MTAASYPDIYNLLPKTNCRECGFPACLAFSVAVFQGKSSIGQCPHFNSQGGNALGDVAGKKSS